MPSKTTDAGKSYEVDGKTFTWHTEDGGDVTLPMRIKLKVIRAMGDRDLDTNAMFDILEAIAPGQGDVLDEMDLNEFTRMFTAWQAEYQQLSGASLGE